MSRRGGGSSRSVQALLFRQLRALGRTWFGKILLGLVALHLLVGLVLVASLGG